MTPGDEVRLVTRARAGDADAFAMLVAWHRSELEALAARQLDDREEARDAVQDAVVRAFQSLQSLRDPAALSRWLAAILRRCCAERRRRSGRRRRLTRLAPPRPGVCWDDVANRLAAKEALSTLPSRESAALQHHYLDGLSVAEVADRLDRPVGTVKRWLHEGRERLRRETAMAEAEQISSKMALVGTDLSDGELRTIRAAARAVGLDLERHQDPWQAWAALCRPGRDANAPLSLIVLARALSRADETFTLMAMLGPTAPPSASHLRDVPVLLLGPADDNIILAAWSAGASAYLTRPPKRAELTEFIRRLVTDRPPREP